MVAGGVIGPAGGPGGGVRRLERGGPPVTPPLGRNEGRCSGGGGGKERQNARGAGGGAYELIMVTEWKEFRSPDLERMKSLLRKPIIFDGRNILEPNAVRGAGFEYTSIGRT